MIVTFDENLPQRKELMISDAIGMFADMLIHPRTIPKLRVDVNIIKTLLDQGECVVEDTGKSPRWFTINVRGKRGDDDIIKTIAHEMVHVKQYATNELGHSKTSVSRGSSGRLRTLQWLGKPYKPNKRNDSYFSSPWEIEAYGREVGLYNAWVLHYNANTEKYW